MKKNELIKKLQAIKGNPKIIISSDMEGNSFEELDEVYDDRDTLWDKESKSFYEREELTRNSGKMERAVILYP